MPISLGDTYYSWPFRPVHNFGIETNLTHLAELLRQPIRLYSSLMPFYPPIFIAVETAARKGGQLIVRFAIQDITTTYNDWVGFQMTAKEFRARIVKLAAGSEAEPEALALGEAVERFFDEPLILRTDAIDYETMLKWLGLERPK